MKTGIKFIFIFGLFISAFGLSGCELFEGGMNTVEPPSHTEQYAPPQESVLKDLAPVRARDMLISEREQNEQKP